MVLIESVNSMCSIDGTSTCDFRWYFLIYFSYILLKVLLERIYLLFPFVFIILYCYENCLSASVKFVAKAFGCCPYDNDVLILFYFSFLCGNRIAKDPRFERLPCTHKGTYADDCIVERVTQVRS